MSILPGLKKISVADVATIMNGICGLLALVFLYLHAPDITWASGLILLGLVFDGADGYLARRFGTKHDLGRYLDSLSDSITFGAAPSLLVFVHYYSRGYGHLSQYLNIAVVGASLLIIVFSWVRLYKFTIEGYKYQGFYGLATPVVTFFVIVVSHILTPDAIIHVLFALPMIYLASILMVFHRVRYPKIRGRLAYVTALGVVLALIILQWAKATFDALSVFLLYRAITYMALGIIIMYVFVSPIYVKFGLKSV